MGYNLPQLPDLAEVFLSLLLLPKSSYIPQEFLRPLKRLRYFCTFIFNTNYFFPTAIKQKQKESYQRVFMGAKKFN